MPEKATSEHSIKSLEAVRLKAKAYGLTLNPHMTTGNMWRLVRRCENLMRQHHIKRTLTFEELRALEHSVAKETAWQYFVERDDLSTEAYWEQCERARKNGVKKRPRVKAPPSQFTQPTLKQESNVKTKVISFINLKGGVAKTTTTIGTAECLATQGHKVLVIDLDPQTNATIMLIGDKRWAELNEHGYTLDSLFDNNKTQNFNLEKTVQVATLCARETRGRVSVLPSSLKLIAKQNNLAKFLSGDFGVKSPVDVLRKALAPIIEEYDYVLIDCPPSLNLITLNGLRMSNGYVIPTIPDILSTYGIPQVIQEAADFAREIEIEIPCLGIVPTKVRPIRLHEEQIALLEQKEEKFAPLFKAQFKERTKLAEVADKSEGCTMHQRWDDMEWEFYGFVRELKERLG